MPETLKGGRWRWYDIEADLRQQAGFIVGMNPGLETESGCGGRVKGTGTDFQFSWKKDECLILTMDTNYEGGLVAALSKVLGYEPFCCYSGMRDGAMIFNVEWVKSNPESRFAILQREPTVERLRLVVDGRPVKDDRVYCPGPKSGDKPN